MVAARRRACPRRGVFLLLLAGVLLAPAARPARADEPRPSRLPHAGYAYPAGARAGATVRVDLGGQRLKNPLGVYVSGGGVHATAGLWIPPPRPLNDAKQRRALRTTLTRLKRSKQTGARAPVRKGAASEQTTTLPKHPLLQDLERKSIPELEEIERYFFVRRSPLQRKRAIEETLRLEVRVDADARPGVRDLRILTKAGLSNPLRFRVGLVPEHREREPNHPDARAAVDLPAVFNGQILPRDADRFRFRARAGQSLLLRVEARDLVPYQADSVPGWMQATLAVLDAEGRELAFADEYRFDPDPVLPFQVPADGEYVVEVRDAVGRGREDFVYRVTVGELPFVTRIYPLGGHAGGLTEAAIEGHNLGWPRVPLDTHAEGGGTREKAWRLDNGFTNPVRYDVDPWADAAEREPNEDPSRATLLELPCVVNGRIARPGDVDVFRFEGRAGKELVAEVRARTLDSPLDSVLRLLDAEGRVVAWNDDGEQAGLPVRGLGLHTHHADSYLRATLPKSGTYFLQVADVRRHGSKAHAYRLRVGPPRPDVEIFVTPSSVTLPAGRGAVIDVHVLRKDGYDGAVSLELAGAPQGFRLGGGRVAEGQTHARMTLTAPTSSPTPVRTLRLLGRIDRGGTTLQRPVSPADNVMQAFLWRHLAPAQELVVAVKGAARWMPRIEVAGEEPLRIARGGKAVARLVVNKRFLMRRVTLTLREPPKGVTLGTVAPIGGGINVEIRVAKDGPEVGAAGNLIVEAYVDAQARKPRKGATRPKDGRAPTRRRQSIGILPAIPYVVVRR